MLGTIKPFDKTDHDIYDKKGKDAFIKYLNNKLPAGYRAIENPDRYGIDILVLSPSDIVVIACDVEVRYGNWIGNVKFPFDKINCIERKDHLWGKDEKFYRGIGYNVSKNCQVYYIQLNDECSKAVIIEGDTILSQTQIPWNNRKMSGEFVRQVPLEKTLEVDL